MKKLNTHECREIQMSVLDEIDRLCKENHLKYSLAYGTLLGAIRHKGYIPWDDDIDIFLLRSDYDKLISLLKNASIKKADWLTLADDTCSDYFYPFAKVYDNRTTVKMERHKGEMGLWVDIFPMDNLPQKQLFEKFFVYYCSFLRVISLSITTDFESKQYDKWTLFYKRIFHTFAKVIGEKRFCRYVERVYQKYANKPSKNVATLFFDTKTDRILDKEKIAETVSYAFENRHYDGVKNYDYYLTEFYSDYMQLPPVEKRYNHGLDCYLKDEKI